MSETRVYNKPSAEEVASILEQALKQPGVKDVLQVYAEVQKTTEQYYSYARELTPYVQSRVSTTAL